MQHQIPLVCVQSGLILCSVWKKPTASSLMPKRFSYSLSEIVQVTIFFFLAPNKLPRPLAPWALYQLRLPLPHHLQVFVSVMWQIYDFIADISLFAGRHWRFFYFSHGTESLKSLGFFCSHLFSYQHSQCLHFLSFDPWMTIKQSLR